MENLANTNAGELSVLDSLAMQARMFIQNAQMNLLQLGRVLIEAKPLVPHGEWENWIKTNTSMSKRQAEQCMQSYKKFGLNSEIAMLGTTKTLKLLPLSDEERETLFSEHDVASMSTRQLDEAIRKQKEKLIQEARETVKSELEAERALRKQAEKRVDEVITANRTLKDSVAEDAETRNLLRNELENLEQKIRERDEIIEEQQEDYNRVQEELLNVKSSIAKGDAERIPSDQLTPDAFAAAVRVFIGTVARMPHMSTTFSVMDEEMRQEYDELLRTVESWAKASRKALDTVTIEGMVIEHEW